MCIACASHTCRLPPSGALLSSIYLKCSGMVKCADAVQMQCRCSVHAVHMQCSRLACGCDQTWQCLPSANAPAHGTPGGSGRRNDRATGCQPLPISGSRVFARASRVAHSTGFGHPDTRTRTGSCTSATVARIRSAHVDSSDVRGCSEHALVSLISSSPSLSLSLWPQASGLHCEQPAEPLEIESPSHSCLLTPFFLFCERDLYYQLPGLARSVPYFLIQRTPVRPVNPLPSEVRGLV